MYHFPLSPAENPLFWVVLSFISGIILSDILPQGHVFTIIASSLFLIDFITIFLVRKKHRKLATALIFFLFLCLGMFSNRLNHLSPHVAYPEEELTYRGTIIESSQSKTAVNHTLWLHSYLKDGKWYKCKKKVRLTTLTHHDSLTFSPGESLLFRCQFQPFVSSGNPYEFDFAEWYHRRGIDCYGYAGNYWQRITNSTLVNDLPLNVRLKIQSNAIRQHLLSAYDSLSLQQTEREVLAALTLGDKTHLTHVTRNLYSQTGVAHILALSGTHLSILIMFLLLLMKPLRYIRRGKFIIFAVSLLFIWTYTWITGMNLSLVRASLMYSMLCLFQLQHRTSDSIHNLSLSAFILLLVDPDSLFDLGFQLSFLAVFSILVLTPRLMGMCPKARIWKLLLGSLFITLSAQLGTSPLVAYQFHQFPIYFILSNLIAIPCAYLLLNCSFLYFITLPLSAISHLFGEALGLAASFLNTALQFISQMPYASLPVYPTLLQVILIYLILILLLLIPFKKHFHRLFLVVILTAILIASQIHKKTTPLSPQIIFYHHLSTSAVHFIQDSNHSWLWSDTSNLASLHNFSANFWQRRLSHQPQLLPFKKADVIITFHGKSTAILNKPIWNLQSTQSPYSVDYLYISKGFKGKVSHLLQLYKPKEIILSSTLPFRQSISLTDSLTAHHIPYRNINTQGAVIISLE